AALHRRGVAGRSREESRAGCRRHRSKRHMSNVRPIHQPPMLRPSSLNILGNVKPADIRLDPYPHVLIHDALPQPIFDALAATFPSLEYVARDEAALNNKACLRGAADVVGDPAVGAIWQDFFA